MTLIGVILTAAAAAATAPAAQNREAPTAPAHSEAREVVETQLRAAPRSNPRPLTRQEKQILLERYLETMGRPIEQPRSNRSRN